MYIKNPFLLLKSTTLIIILCFLFASNVLGQGMSEGERPMPPIQDIKVQVIDGVGNGGSGAANQGDGPSNTIGSAIGNADNTVGINQSIPASDVMPQPQVVQPTVVNVQQIKDQQPSAQTGSIQPVTVDPVTSQPIIVQPTVVTPQQSQPSQSGQIIVQPIVTQLQATINPEQSQQATPQQPSATASAQPTYQRNTDNPSLDLNTPNPQRSARYKAQQQRLAEMRRKAQAQAQTQPQFSPQQVQSRSYTPEPKKISPTQQTRNKQRTQSRQLRSQLPLSIPKKTILFEIDRSIEEFIVEPTSNFQYFLHVIIYTLQNNAYGLIKDIEKAGRLKVYVYEDNSRIMGQGEYYFQGFMKFEVKKGSAYTIRFYNQGIPKLISLSFPTILQSSHIQSLYSKQQGQQHLWKADSLSVVLSQVTQKLKLTSLMDRTNNQLLMTQLRSYSGYQILEMIVLVVVCGVQVKMVKGLFEGGSIL